MHLFLIKLIHTYQKKKKPMMFQVARVRLHGFSEREISIVRALLMSEIESAYLERDQMQSTSLRDEYLQVHPNCSFLGASNC